MSDNDLEGFSDKKVEKVYAHPDEAKIPAPLQDEKGDDTITPVRVQWSSHGSRTSIGAGRTYGTLTPGVYAIDSDRGEPIFIQREVNIDNLLEFPDSKADSILKEIGTFWDRSEEFKKFGFLHRRGILLWGSAGGGKSSIIQQIIKRIINKKGIVFLYSHPKLLDEGLSVFREIEPERNVVCIFEDIDSIIQTYGEDTLLSVLDGEAQINRVLNIASTNYPEKLDKRIVALPRRFDRVIKIGMPSAQVREAYFIHKLKISPDEVKKWVSETKEFSFAAMAELVISVKCLGNPFKDSVDSLRKLLDNKLSSNDFDDKMGFGR